MLYSERVNCFARPWLVGLLAAECVLCLGQGRAQAQVIDRAPSPYRVQ